MSAADGHVPYELPPSADGPIWDIWLSFFRLPAMAVADECGVFQAIAGGAGSAAEISSKLGFDRRATEAVLDMLASMSLLRAAGGRFQLTDTAAIYLLPDSPFYWGPLLRSLGVLPHHHRALICLLKGEEAPAWPRPNRPEPPSAKAGGPEVPAEAWAKGQMTSSTAELVTRVMHTHSLPAAVALGRSRHFDEVSRLLDVGGASGCFSIALAQRHAKLRCTVMDLPAVCKAAEGYIAAGGVADRVDTRAVDMFRDAWPTGYDAVFLSNVFHDWAPETNAEIARAAFTALPVGGKVILHEMLADPDGGATPMTTAAFSMLMLATTKGKQYSFAELGGILEAAGFRSTRAHATYGYYSVVIATKP